MRIAIIGAGATGVTTAWELARDGHHVVVFEQRQGIAEEGSFATGGLQSWLGASSTLTHGARQRLWRAWWRPPVGGNGGERLAAARWLWRVRQSDARGLRTPAMAALQALESLSRARQTELDAALESPADTSEGHLLLWRHERDYRASQSWRSMARDAGLPLRELTADEVRRHEPALREGLALAAAWLLPQDRAVNCRQWLLLARSAATRLGVEWRMGTRVSAAVPAHPGVRLQLDGPAAEDGMTFDAVVLCSGAALPLLPALSPSSPLRRRLQTVWGFSVSAPVRESLHAPRTTLTDMGNGVTLGRLGQRVRITGGYHTGPHAATLASTAPARVPDLLYRTLHQWFPGATTLQQGVQQWRGASLHTDDGLPLVGASGVPGLWLNLAHGAHGWRLACGSARLLADLMAGRPCEVAAEPFSPTR